jgi:cyanate permease
LPELFVTRVRSVGAGVCFNLGRIITAITVFVTAGLIAYFDNDFGQIGRITSLIYLLGAVGILLMPKGVEGEIKD